jgi:hypothetical protein
MLLSTTGAMANTISSNTASWISALTSSSNFALTSLCRWLGHQKETSKTGTHGSIKTLDPSQATGSDAGSEKGFGFDGFFFFFFFFPFFSGGWDEGSTSLSSHNGEEGSSLKDEGS